jgi:phage-related minor tail protein
MKSPEEGEVSWGQRYKDARRRLDKVEQDISKLKAELSQAWDARKDERWKHLIGDRSMLQQRMVYLQEERNLVLKRENADLEEERNLMLKGETTATGTVNEYMARCPPYLCLERL